MTNFTAKARVADRQWAPRVWNSASRAAESRFGSPGTAAGWTLGEVYAIPRVPTFNEGIPWHHGKSRIRSPRGKESDLLVGWITSCLARALPEQDDLGSLEKNHQVEK